MPAEKQVYWEPMMNALKELQNQLPWEEINISGAILSDEIKQEIKKIVDLLIKNSSFWPIEWIEEKPVYCFTIPDFPDFNLSVLANEPWLTDEILASILFAWLANKDLRDN